MFFYASKIIWFFLQPSALAMLLILAGLLITRTRWQRWARPMIITGSLALLLIAFSPLGRFIVLPLENRFPTLTASALTPGSVDGIIVLGGAVHMTLTKERGVPTIAGAGERIMEAAILARQHPKAKVLITGGPTSFGGKTKADAEITRDLLVALGISAGRIHTETRARNTFENAKFSKETGLIKEGETWLLVTSAFHMPRAMGCFRANGLAPTPYPVDYMTGGKGELTLNYFAMDGITTTDVASKEWVGLLAYWLTGRINTLFPG